VCSSNNFGPDGATAIAAQLALLTSLQAVDLRCPPTPLRTPAALSRTSAATWRGASAPVGPSWWRVKPGWGNMRQERHRARLVPKAMNRVELVRLGRALSKQFTRWIGWGWFDSVFASSSERLAPSSLSYPPSPLLPLYLSSSRPSPLLSTTLSTFLALSHSGLSLILASIPARWFHGRSRGVSVMRWYLNPAVQIKKPAVRKAGS
jgi:hypothetical protein